MPLGDLKNLTRRKSVTFEIAPTLSWTLLHGTKLVNATKQARAQLDEAVHNFNETVLTAVQETDNAMNNYRNSIEADCRPPGSTKSGTRDTETLPGTL